MNTSTRGESVDFVADGSEMAEFCGESTPLVMERSTVQSCPAAPAQPTEITDDAADDPECRRSVVRHIPANIGRTRRRYPWTIRGLRSAAVLAPVRAGGRA